MLRKLLLTGIFLLSFCLYAFAQSGTITGTITDAETGEPVISANIFIPSIERGAATDVDGEFTIDNVQTGTYTLRITYVGYKQASRDVEVGSGTTTVNIELEQALIGLDDVVVTAQGIEREKRALGYAVSTVDNEAIENKGQSDITRTLRGKIPGVNITQTSGVSGTATDFVIRGYSTISGTNQPLFIVDGVQFDISTNSGSNFQDGGALSSSSRFLDIDPNNIKNVNVLKGLSATTIYGEKGRNGVVLIQTKSGSFDEDREPGFEVSINQSVFANQIASVPDYQDEYGGGFHQNFGFFFSNWGPSFDRDLSDNSLFIREGENGRNIIQHPYSQFSSEELIAAFPQFQPGGEQHEYAYRPYDNVEEFFRTGLVNNTSLNISGGTQDVNLNLNIGRSNEEGFTPGNEVIKNNVGLGANFRAFDRLTVKSTANLSLTDQSTPPIATSFGSSASGGGGGSVFGDVFYTPRSTDLNGLPFTNPVDGGSVYYRSGNDIQNPLWTVENSGSTDNVNRLFGKIEAIYELSEGLNASYKVGLDTYSENQSFFLNQGGVTNPDLATGYYNTTNIQNTIWDHSMFLNYSRDINESISLDGLVGGQFVLEKFERDGIGSQNQIIFDLFEHGNFRTPSATNFFSGADFGVKSREETAGLFFDATFGYEDYVYLNVSGRNDWFSTVEPENRSVFYPSVSISFIPTDAFDFGGDALNYLKIRAGVGTSAGAPGPYNTRSTLASNPRGFLDASGNVITTNAISNRLGNRELQPELLTEFELGIEARFLDNRVGIDLTVYDKVTEDLITDANLDPATGFTVTNVNIGEVQNRGLELALNTTPIRGAFQWNSNFNFFTYESIVNELGQDLDQIAVSGFTNLGNFAIEGKPLNIMQGSLVERNDAGNRVVNGAGEYITADEIGIIGNPNPEFTLSNINTFNFKNFSLTAQVDYQQGGDIYSTTIASLLARGISSDTGFDRQVPLILPGDKQNGEPNDIQISATQAYFGNIGFGPDENYVYDATNFRLSELSLSYNLPVSILSKTPLQQVSLTLSGFNLYYFTPFIPEGTNLDPNVAGFGADNGLGFDLLAGPSARRFGGTVSVRF